MRSRSSTRRSGRPAMGGRRRRTRLRALWSRSPIQSRGRSANRRTAPPASSPRQTITAIEPARKRLCSTGAPVMRIEMMLITGSPNSVAVEISETAVTLVAAQVMLTPAWRNMSHCIAPPAAAPAGTSRLIALPATCAVATGNQRRSSSARRSSAQAQTKLATSASAMGRPHRGWTVLSWGPDSNTAARLGHTTYRPIPVMPSVSARLVHTARAVVGRVLTTCTCVSCRGRSVKVASWSGVRARWRTTWPPGCGTSAGGPPKARPRGSPRGSSPCRPGTGPRPGARSPGRRPRASSPCAA